jgi:hypothetical protein
MSRFGKDGSGAGWPGVGFTDNLPVDDGFEAAPEFESLIIGRLGRDPVSIEAEARDRFRPDRFSNSGVDDDSLEIETVPAGICGSTDTTTETTAG